ncbi:hypothetical protein HDU92_001287 [Lobulomyces angularis]|nr:hypothetical protein HDU92_001287 [Lobulomyces angularis]
MTDPLTKKTSLNYPKYVINFGLLLIFAFTVLYYVVYERHDETKKIPGYVQSPDIVNISFYFLPLGILIALAQIFTPLSPPQTTTQEFFNRKITTHIFGINSIGKLLFFILMIAVNIFWWFTPILMRDDLHEFTTIDWLSRISLKAAIPGMWDMALSIIFYCRENRVLSYLMKDIQGKNNIDETGLHFHKIFGVISFTLIALHSIGYAVVFYIEDELERLVPLSRKGLLGFFGIISWTAMILMIATSIYLIRRKYYKLFFWTHQLYIVAIIFAVLHDSSVIYYIIPALLFLVYDKFAPRITSSEFRNAIAKIYSIDESIVRLDISLPGKQDFPFYPAGSWVNICFPTISKLDWHPFSITSHHGDNKKIVTIIVASKGKWSKKIFDLTVEGKTVEVPIKLNGYFGSSPHTKENTRNLLIAGGTGVSALIPFLAGVDLSSLNFVWVLKKPSDALLYTEFLLDLKKAASKSRFKPKFYCTKSIEIPLKIHEETRNIIHRYNTSRKRTSTSKTIYTKHYKLAAISMLVFIFGNLGYMIGRWIQISPANFAKCRNFQTGFYMHFMCYYWLNGGPLLLSVLFPIVIGTIATFLFNKSSRSKETPSNVDKFEIKEKAITRQLDVDFHNEVENTLNFLKESVCKGRPNFNDLPHMFPNNSEDDRKLYIYVAGPPGFNKDVENACKKNRIGCFVETWEK